MSTRDKSPTEAATTSTLDIAKDAGDDSSPATPKDFRFWLVFLAVGISTMLTALELSAVSTTLPRIVNSLHGSDFVWVGSAYALSATAFIPLSGGLAQIFGRRVVMLGSLFIMAVGSALCGAATSMAFLIGGRVVQGLGGGGIASTTAIIISDLIPLKERGIYNSVIGVGWASASGVGPIVGGALADAGQWRWLFYLNIPICGVAAVLVYLFLRVPRRPGSLKEKLARIDWIGNLLVIAATTSCIIALTWSGIEHAWTSAAVLVPLILGLVGLVAFMVYEATIPREPLIPFVLMSNITGLSGYLQSFIMPIVLLGIIYYIPVYFQACKGASPIGAGVDQLGIALFSAPMGIISGLTVHASRRYRPQLWIAWIAFIVSMSLFSTLREDTSKGHAIGYEVIAAIGSGTLTACTYFPVLAPLPVSQNGPALAYFMFLRNFAQVWGIAIGGSILQNQLQKRLPPDFSSQFPGGTAIAYASIPLISDLPEPLKTQVRVAFSDSLNVVFEVLAGISGLGLLVSLGMKHLPLHTAVDKDFGLEEKAKKSESDAA